MSPVKHVPVRLRDAVLVKTCTSAYKDRYEYVLVLELNSELADLAEHRSLKQSGTPLKDGQLFESCSTMRSKQEQGHHEDQGLKR